MRGPVGVMARRLKFFDFSMIYLGVAGVVACDHIYNYYNYFLFYFYKEGEIFKVLENKGYWEN